jgi:hypothetical protein
MTRPFCFAERDLRPSVSAAVDRGRPLDLGSSQHCAIVAVQIVGFTGQGRDDEVQLALRAAVFQMLITAFDAAGVGWEECPHEDRIDGVLVIVPLRMPTAVLIDPLLPHLQAGLRLHNRLSAAIARIGLRVAIHIGEVHRDHHGFAGTAINHVVRLIETPGSGEAPTAGGAELCLIVSDYVYDSVVRHCRGLIDPTAFQPVIATVEESRPRRGSGNRRPHRRSLQWAAASQVGPVPTATSRVTHSG